MGPPQPVDSVETESALPDLSEAEIRNLTDAQSFTRGRSYHRGGSIYDTFRRGLTLHGRCHGSSGGPYRVEATLSSKEPTVATWSCDCPRGGFCKHVVALLLTWIDSPDVFEPRPAIAEMLSDLDRDQLVGLIEEMARREPDLERVIERARPPAPIPPAKPGTAALRTVDVSSVRRQASAVFANEHDYWEDDDHGETDAEAAKELARLCDLGDQYAAAGRWADAQAVYTTIAEQAMARRGEVYDEDPIGDVVLRCGAALLRCLDEQARLPKPDRLPEPARGALIETIFAIWRFDNGVEESAAGAWIAGTDGGIDLGMTDGLSFSYGGLATGQLVVGDEDDDWEEQRAVNFDVAAVIARAATVAERERIVGWVRELARPGPGGRSAWSRRAAIQLLHSLKGGSEGSDNDLLESYKAAELWGDAIALLVKMGKLDEATALAARTLTTPQAAMSFGNLLLSLGEEQVERAIAFIDGRLWETEGKQPRNDLQLLGWLSATYGRFGSPRKAFDVDMRRFGLRHDFAAYSDVRVAATLPGQEPGLWERARPDLLKDLEKRNAWDSVLLAHLQEGDVGAAIAALHIMEEGKRRPKPDAHGYGGWWNVPHYQDQVAAAAEKAFPDEAIRLRRLLAEQAIAQKNRGSYQTAAHHLGRIKAILDRQGRAEEWRRVIDTLRTDHKRLPALQDELTIAGLR